MTSNSRERGKKKLYQKPILRVYGDVRALTQAIATHTKNSDAIGKGKKTA